MISMGPAIENRPKVTKSKSTGMNKVCEIFPSWSAQASKAMIAMHKTDAKVSGKVLLLDFMVMIIRQWGTTILFNAPTHM